MSTTNRHVIVIGGGLAGLAAAAELSTAGIKVTLIEANHHLGGKMNLLQEKGFSFDMGPTILTLPSVLHRIFGEANRRLDLKAMHAAVVDGWNAQVERSAIEDDVTIVSFEFR